MQSVWRTVQPAVAARALGEDRQRKAGQGRTGILPQLRQREISRDHSDKSGRRSDRRQSDSRYEFSRLTSQPKSAQFKSMETKQFSLRTSKNCEHCGALLTRKSFQSSRERTSVFLRRKYCGDECREAAQTKRYVPVNGMKKCSDCAVEKPLEAFAIQSSRPSGRQSKCRECHNRAAKRSYAKHKDKRRDWHLKTTFGITLTEYETMLVSQKGRCVICGREELTAHTRGGKGAIRLAVDHCHDTGVVRGLLCRNCNTAIGKLRHDPALLRAAINYLENKNGNT